MKSINSIFPLTGSKLKGGSPPEWAGPCPRCKDGDDRFLTWPDTGLFWCRQCDWKGDEIQFLHDTEGLSYVEACDRLGVEPKTYSSSKKEIIRSPEDAAAGRGRWEPKPAVLPNDQWIAQASVLVDQCAKYINKDKQGMEYALSRGLTPETIKKYKIGWNPGDLYLPREGWGFEPEKNPETGKLKKQFVSKGLIIPTIAYGSVVDIKVRRYPWAEAEGMGKYIAVSGGSGGPLVLSGGPVVVVVESEIDALLVAQEAQILATVVALRSASNRPDLETTTKLLRPAPLILIATDCDEAGAKAWMWWKENFPTNSFRWPVPIGKDVGEMVEAGVPVKDWVKAGISELIENISELR